MKALPTKPPFNYNVRLKPVIGRMLFCSVKDMERYCVRLLLLRIKGAESFKELRTDAITDPSNPVEHPTFHRAAIAMGLLDDGLEWHRCLDEAALEQMPGFMIQLFALLLMNCDVPDPQDLWDSHKHQLISNRVPALVDYNVYMAYMSIEKIVQGNNPSMSLLQTFHIPIPTYNGDAGNADQAGNEQAQALNHAAYAALNVPKLNIKQILAYDAIMDSLVNKSGKQFFPG